MSMDSSTLMHRNIQSLMPPEVTSDPSSTLDSHHEDNEELSLRKWEDFIVILPDEDFVTRTGGVVHRGVARSEYMKGKFCRKFGPTDVLSLSDAQNDTWIRVMQPGPTEYMIYRKHPFSMKVRFIGVDVFHWTIIDEMISEFQCLCMLLGAKAITFNGHPRMGTTVPCPQYMAPYIDHASTYTYLHHIPEYTEMVRRRLDEWCDSYSFQFSYTNDFNVNNDLLEKVIAKMNIDKDTKKDLFSYHIDNTSYHSIKDFFHEESPSKSPASVIDVFRAVRVHVTVSFFSVQDYQDFNREWISVNWSTFHVSAYLRVISMSHLEKVFFDKDIDGRRLLLLNTTREGTATVGSSANGLNISSKDFDDLNKQLNQLGRPDMVSLMQQVHNEECRVRAEYDRKIALMVAASTANSTPVKISSAVSSRETSPIGTSKVGNVEFDASQVMFIEGIYELVMCGEGAVGKTSIMNRLCERGFNPTERPTMGTQLIQHPLGKLVIDIWDVAGQKSQFGSVKAKAKRADILFAVYDVSNRESLDALQSILADLHHGGMQPWTSVVLLGNKADISDNLRQMVQQVSLEDGLIFARQNMCASFFETSAKTGYNIKEALSNALLKSEQEMRGPHFGSKTALEAAQKVLHALARKI